MSSAIDERKTVTINLTKADHFPQPMFKIGQIMIVKGKYNMIIKSDGKSFLEGHHTITIHPLSKWKFLRKLQIFFIKLKIKYTW